MNGKVMEIVKKGLIIGAFPMMCQAEKDKGYKLLFPGEADWLPKEDWLDNIVVSRDGDKVVRIVAIMAKNPGTGAFSRMITGIAKAGLFPVVVCPTFEMDTICCKHWKWNKRETGTTFEDGETQLYPTKKWLQQRKEKICVTID